MVPAHLGSPGRGPLNGCVYVCVINLLYLTYISSELLLAMVQLLVYTETLAHTHSHLMAFVRDCLGEPVPEETFTNSHPRGRRRRIRSDSKVHCMRAHPFRSALCQRGLLDPIKPAYNWSLLKLTASAFDQLWISMLAVLVTVPTVTQNSLRPLSPSSCIACHLLDFMVQGKITEADTSTIRLDATLSGLLVPLPPSSPHFYAGYLLQPSRFILA